MASSMRASAAGTSSCRRATIGAILIGIASPFFGNGVRSDLWLRRCMDQPEINGVSACAIPSPVRTKTAKATAMVAVIYITLDGLWSRLHRSLNGECCLGSMPIVVRRSLAAVTTGLSPFGMSIGTADDAWARSTGSYIIRSYIVFNRERIFAVLLRFEGHCISRTALILYSTFNLSMY